MMSGDKAKKRVLRKKIKKITFGVTDVLMNVVLYTTYLSLSVMTETGSGSRKIHKSFNKTDEVFEEIDATKIRKALYNLAQKGLVQIYKDELVLPKITKAGLERINSIFPRYDENRVWDKRLYIVNYDIPREYNRDRDILRIDLEKFNAVRLQDSVYLTPFNPRDFIHEIVKTRNIHGQILVSTLDPKDAFGSINIKDFLWDIYDLENLNDGYSLFIYNYNKYTKQKAVSKKTRIAFDYFSILKYDPQLPFELLHDKYLGDEAYLLFKKLLNLH